MELLTQLLQALWAQDFETLANPSMIGMLYFVLFVILFLENGLLPAAFLPGDSLLVLVGVLIAKGAMGYPQTILLLTVAASLGCWVSYIQGRWLGNTRTVQNWLSHLPAHYHQRAHHLFHKHGLSALLIGRFIAFVRTLLPTIAGLSGLNNARFQFFNWMSGLLWVLILTTLGYMLGKNAGIFKVRGPADVMPDAAPGGAAGVWPGRFSGRIMEKEIWKSGVRDANTSHVASPASLVRRCFTSGRHAVAGLVRGSPARVYAGDSCRSSRHNDARRFFNLASP